MVFFLFWFIPSYFFFNAPPENGIFFIFKGEQFFLKYPMQPPGNRSFSERGHLDTMSSWYDLEGMMVEIIRQDRPDHPSYGMAFRFEFDESNGEYPYTPAEARVQLKNFSYGGLEFSPRDTFNYTGLSNSFSEDLTVEIDTFYLDTIVGRFSGLLLSGAGPMEEIREGRFKARLYRK